MFLNQSKIYTYMWINRLNLYIDLKLHKSRISRVDSQSNSRRAYLANGYARLRDDRTSLGDICEGLASDSRGSYEAIASKYPEKSQGTRNMKHF